MANWVHKPALGRQARSLTAQIGMLIVINLVFGFALSGTIDNAAHIGGLLCGAWLGLVVAPRGTQTPDISVAAGTRGSETTERAVRGHHRPGRHRTVGRRAVCGTARDPVLGLTYLKHMGGSILNVLIGTFTLRFSTALTGGLLAYYLGNLSDFDGPEVSAIAFAVIHAAFYATELVASPVFGLLSDKLGHHRVMQFGPIFGAVAVVITAVTPDLLILTGTRVLEGAATAASIPSILGFLAMATMKDEGLRGRVSARFELATIAGLGAGIGASGIFWQLLDRNAFFLNAAFYLGSYAIYRFGVRAPDAPAGPHHRPEYGWQRYLSLIRTSHIWLLAPTWIAVNAALGVYAGQGLFNLVRTPNPQFADQLLAGGLSPFEVTAGLIAAGAVFVAGIVYWGNRFKQYRRTTIILYGIIGGFALVVGAILFNHSAGVDPLLRLPLAIVAGAGLFVLAGATPAALGLLADMSEAYPDDRGAVMGLYGVFLAIGQIGGSFAGGYAAEIAAIDGLLVATLVFMAIAVVPLYWLRRYEHHFEGALVQPEDRLSSPERPA